MNLLEIYLLACALAADAVSVGAAVGLKHRAPRQLFRLSFHFGLFQGLMPLIGAFLGSLILPLIESWDHWLICMILAGLGINMIYGAKKGGQHKKKVPDLTRGGSLIALSVAVSIDALGAGISLPSADSSIYLSAAIIAVIAALGTLVSMLMANIVAKYIGGKLELVAGLVLICLGIKIVMEHV